MSPDEFLKIVVVGGVSFGGLYALLTVVRVWARKSERGQADPVVLTELREGMQRLSGEVADLQERLDFAERLLAQHREAPRVKGDS